MKMLIQQSILKPKADEYKNVKMASLVEKLYFMCSLPKSWRCGEVSNTLGAHYVRTDTRICPGEK